MAETRLMGILNVTPDSFSDGGAHAAPETAIAAVERLIGEGADIIDIGAESTRPGATPLAPEEEWQRLAPVLAALPRFKGAGVCFSVDTRHAKTAEKALDAGVRWINDVSGFADPAMVKAVKSRDCMLVAMHSLSVPADKNIVMPESEDPVQAVSAWAKARIAALEAEGIARERIIIDPGIGFGKTAAQSLAILGHIRRIDAGAPLLVGHSRKSFLAPFGGGDDATLAVSQYLAQQGVAYLRVHAVARHRQMLNMLKVLGHG